MVTVPSQQKAISVMIKLFPSVNKEIISLFLLQIVLYTACIQVSVFCQLDK